MDSATFTFLANFLAKKAATYLAVTLVTIGALHTGSDQVQFVTVISGVLVGLIEFVWSWWNDRGKQKVLAFLAKAHRVAPDSASTAAASKALVESVNDNKVVPIAGGAVKIAAAMLLGFLVLDGGTTLAHAQTKAAPVKKLTVAQAQSNPIAMLQQFSITDLQAALADAQASNDVTTIPCWTALLAAAQAQQSAAPVLPAGVFSAIQKARDLKVQAANLLAPNGPLAQLNVACAPLLMDANATLLALGVGTGVVVGTGGIALPALPGFLPLLLAPK